MIFFYSTRSQVYIHCKNNANLIQLEYKNNQKCIKQK